MPPALIFASSPVSSPQHVDSIMADSCLTQYYEGDANPFGDFYAEGSFTDRTYTFKSGGLGGEMIARVRRDPEVFRDVDGYVVEVAAGVDAAAILAMAVVIDEDHDEADAKAKRVERPYNNDDIRSRASLIIHH